MKNLLTAMFILSVMLTTFSCKKELIKNTADNGKVEAEARSSMSSGLPPY